MPLPALIIKDSNGSTKASIDADAVSATTAHRRLDRGTASVPRDDWNSVSVDARLDRLELERPDGTRLFGGRLDDAEPAGDGVDVRAVSYRRDLMDAEPTALDKTFTNVSDDTVVKDAINAVSTLSTGSIANLENNLVFEFPNSSRSKQLDKVGVATGGVVRVNADRTVDYQQRFGSDRAGDVVISPRNANVTGRPTITKDRRDEVTHIKAFGARDGELVRTATAPSYGSGRKVWREFEDTDIRDPQRLQTIADRLVGEFDGEPTKLTVDATIVGTRLNRGDEVTVRLPGRGVDRVLTVKSVTERFAPQAGQIFDATLTNRLVDDDAAGSSQESLQRFNRGFQGIRDRIQDSIGWNAAGDGVPQTLEVFGYPSDIIEEKRVNLIVQGRAWRSPVEATGHSHDVDVTHPSHSHDVSVTHPSHNHAISTTSADNGELTNTVVEIGSPLTSGGLPTKIVSLTSGSWSTIATVSPSADTSNCFAWTAVENTDDNDAIVGVRVENTSELTVYDETVGRVNPADTVMFPVYIPENVNGDNLEIQGRTDSTDIAARIEYQFVGGGQHNHSVSDTTTTELGTTSSETSSSELGTTTSETSTSTTDFAAKVIDSFNSKTYYPTDVEIKVDGTTVTTVSGNNSSDWQETVDLIGELSGGQNTITAEPTGQRGQLNLIFDADLYRRGP